uniref:Uncharacterized protein n=1 Tax=Cyanophora sudae TaxID=1522369 RepID=A0A2Z4HG16_9EUKA|nr:hypothetical protein [Cyanophora sudae]AWW13730.1 hypothetical protein [Cyanophora sudae]
MYNIRIILNRKKEAIKLLTDNKPQKAYKHLNDSVRPIINLLGSEIPTNETSEIISL